MPKIMNPVVDIVSILGYWAIILGCVGGPGIWTVDPDGMISGSSSLQDPLGRECKYPHCRGTGFCILYFKQPLLCSSILVMTYFPLRDYYILPKKELHSSLWVENSFLDLIPSYLGTFQLPAQGRILTSWAPTPSWPSAAAAPTSTSSADLRGTVRSSPLQASIPTGGQEGLPSQP